MSKSRNYLLIGFFALIGLSVLAETALPFSFEAGQPIKADDVNANFSYLNDGKQNLITGSPCGDGQFVKGIDADGAVSCAIDQIGSAGSTGVSSLNGQTGSLAIEGGEGINITTSEDGTIKINAVNGTEFSTQASIALPGNGAINYSGAAFSVKNNSTANFSSAIAGTANASGAFGVYGVSTAGQGVRGNATSGYGVVGTSTTGQGVRGMTTAGKTGVYGLNTNKTSFSTGVWGQSDTALTFGVYGSSANGFGTAGITNTGTGVLGQVNSTSAGITSAGVSGVNAGTAGYGVRGEHKGNGYGVYGTAPKVGVGGESAFVGVYGKAPVAMNAVGNAVQSMGSFGWAKAMVFVDQTNIIRCFNSQVSVALMQSNGCGFRIVGNTRGTTARHITIDFGFDVSKTFPLLTIGGVCDGDGNIGGCSGQAGTGTGNQMSVQISDLDDDPVDRWSFYLFLF